MPPYKKQHYLPAAYFKYFSDDQLSCSRKSNVWRYDGKSARRVIVESQGFDDYFYSKESPAETEKLFKGREDSYCRFLDTLRAGQEPSEIEYGDLFLSMADLNLRNAIHKNLTGKEGVDAYNHRLEIFFAKLLLGDTHENTPPNKQTIIQHLINFWRIEVIPAPPSHEFATSDNPSVFATSGRPSSNGRLPLESIFLPLDPHHLAFAFDRRSISARKQQATFADVWWFNHVQIHNSEDCVYKASPFSEQELAVVQEPFSNKSTPVCEVTNDGWRSYFLRIPTEFPLSFAAFSPDSTR